VVREMIQPQNTTLMEANQYIHKTLAGLLDERTDIVGFFHKHDEVKRLRRDIGRMLLGAGVELSGRKKKALINSFMELARTKFGSR